MRSSLILPSLMAALAAAALPFPGAAAEIPSAVSWPQQLQHKVLGFYRRGFTGSIHLYVKDLHSGVRYTHNAATPTYLASVVKVPFMISLFDMVERGEASLDETVVYKQAHVRGGAPLFNYLPIGAQMPLRVVVEAMIQQSDNAASDIVANRVGLDRVNADVQRFGWNGFGRMTSLLKVRRLVYGRIDRRFDDLGPSTIRGIDYTKGAEGKAAKLNGIFGVAPGTYTAEDIERAYAEYYTSGVNSAPMETVGRMLEALALGKVVSPEASKEMVEMMAGTQTGEGRISSRLPPSARIAHKTGTQYRRTCDVGLMFLPGDRPVVFAACLSGGSGGRRDAVISYLARATYDLLLPSQHAQARRANAKKRLKKKRIRRRKRAPRRSAQETTPPSQPPPPAPRE